MAFIYRNKDNSKKTPLGIHCAPLGTHERFIGFLIVASPRLLSQVQ